MLTTLPTSSSPTAIIADDERLMRDQLRARLAEAWPELQIVAEAKHGQEAVELAARHQPDLVFLDIRMPGMTGLDAAQVLMQAASQAQTRPPHVVFITAYDEYALQAFEQGAIDYLLKPAEPERLARTVERLQQRLAKPTGAVASLDALMAQLSSMASKWSSGSAPASVQRLRWIQASVGSTIQMIAVDDVLFLISDEKYTRVQTAHMEALIRKPIKELIDELDPEEFWQIHRSTLVRASAIEHVVRDDRGRLMVAVRGHPERLEVSRSHLGRFKGM